MTVLSARKMVCDKLSSEFDTLLQPVNDAKGVIKSQIDKTKSTLSLMTFSPVSEINSAVSNLENDIKGLVPEAETPDIDEIMDFVKSCDFLKGHSMLNNPISLLKGGISSAIGEAAGFVDELTGLLPEFDAAQIIGNILNKFSGMDLGLPDALGITGVMQAADKIINCIVGRCGSEYSSRITEMTNTLDDLYTDLNIVSDPTSANWGEFDINKLYDDVALSAQERIQMSTVVDSVKKSQTSVTDAINSTVNATKSAARSVEGLF